MFSNNKNLVFSFIGGATFSLLVAALYFSFFATKRSFPSFEDGKYFANIQWEDLRGVALPNSFVLKKAEAKFSLFFSHPHAEEVSGSLVRMQETTDRFEPLQIQSSVGSFLLFSDPSDPTSKNGAILEVGTGREGSWQLVSLDLHPVTSMGDSKETSLQLALLLEEEYVTSRLEKNQIQVQEVLAETARIEEQLESIEQLRAEGKQRVQEIEASLSNISQEKEAMLKTLGTLAQQLQLARRVTKFGEVIKLSRQAMQLDEALYLQSEDFLDLEVPGYEEYEEPGDDRVF